MNNTLNQEKLENLNLVLDSKIVEEIKEIISHVINKITVISIYFFGSGLYKSYAQINDLDFLIVVSDSVTNTRAISQKLNSEIKRLEHPCDFLVVRASTLEKNKDVPFYIYKTILEEGLKIYGKG